MQETLGTFIRDRRMELGLTQEELAERVGDSVRQAEISRLERDRVTLPRRLRMEQIARALDVPIGQLLLKSGWSGAEAISDDPDNLSDANPDGRSGPVQAGRLQAENDALRAANDRLRVEADVREAAVAVIEAIVSQLQAMLNGVHAAVVVVNRTGLIVLENTSYTVFTALYTDEPIMLDAHGVRIPDAGLPLERAANGDRFSMRFDIERDGNRRTFVAHGQPMSTTGGLLGVVTILADSDHDGFSMR